MFRNWPLAFLVSGVLCSPMANAALINNYSFNGSNGAGLNSVTDVGTVAGGPSVTVTGYRFVNGSWSAEQVGRNSGALGVDSDPNDSNDAQIGSRLEGLLFDLGTQVSGSFRLDFTLLQGTDSVDIWAGTANMITTNFSGATQVGNNSTSNPFVSGWMPFRYIFVANTSDVAARCDGTNDGCFRVDNLMVVPEPGSLGLVGGGLLLAGFVRRRRAPR